jgi:hypothetical protein
MAFTPGKETSVDALGKRWTVGRLSLKIIFSFRDWIKAQIGDPYARLERMLPHYSPEDAKRRIAEIDRTLDELEAFTLQSAIAQRFMSTELGGAVFWKLLLSEHHPNVTDEEALAILQEIGERAQAEAVAKATGKGEPAGNEPALEASTT